MAFTGPIWGLDLAVCCGVAIGAAGGEVKSCSVRLKKPDEHRAVAFENLIAFLDEGFRAERPCLVVKEAMLPLEAFRALGNAESTVRLHAGLHANVEGMCGRFEIPWRDVSVSTVRKHFIGKGNAGSRAETKLAVVQRCHVLGLMPKDCKDDNRADACAVHDWACAVFGKRSASDSRLFLFDEQPGAVE